MSYFAIILLAFALSIDACAVSFTYGLVYKKNKIKNSLKLAFTTGIFQGIMPLIGYFLVSLIRDYILIYADMIVFLIFGYLGIKFIEEAFKDKDISKFKIKKRKLFLIGIATSVDAFSAGITLSLCGNNIIKPSLMIGVITFINSIIGFYGGTKLRKFSTKWLEITAGCILLLIGTLNLF